MSTHVKSTALYKTPFSKAYWQDAAAELKSTKTLVIAALMIALRVASKGLALPIAPNLDLFNLASFINALSAMIIGPVMAIPAAFLSDFLGVLIWDGLGTYFLPYALQEIASSLIWALLLYRAKATPWRVMLGRFAICIFVNVLLGTGINMWWQMVYYGNSTVVLTIPRIVKNTFMFPIESVVMTFFLGLMIPITNRMGLTYTGANAKEALTFGKKQIALLIVLFVVGVGCVTSYLFYYYDTTSLSASYTAEERFEKNCEMDQLVHDNTDNWDQYTTITTVESAYKKLGEGYTTYNVAVYVVDESALTNSDYTLESLRGLSKSKAAAAAKAGVMTRAANVTIQVDNKTGQVLEYTVDALM
jgi:ECF transporter S component (folate family)